jgi:hypothetical protein
MHYVASFFAGAFFANAVPHFVYGVCGDRFPTPFAKPPGKGLSSAMVNVLWGLLNGLLGAVLFREARVMSGDGVLLLVLFAGIAVMSIASSLNFAKKHAE